MAYGQLPRPVSTPRSWPAVFLLLLAFAAPPAPARPAPASEIAVTLLSVGPGAIQVQGADGRTMAVRIAATTWVLRRGLVALPRDLTPGETLQVRLSRTPSGPALLVCDSETAEALAAHRRRPLLGVVASVENRLWTVQPADGGVPLPVCLSERTTFRAGGAPIAASAFGAGASVTITTRGLANGLLSAVSVSEAGPGPVSRNIDPGAAPPRSLSGVLLEVRPDLGLLTIQDASGTARTVAVAAVTRVRSGGRASALEDLTTGVAVLVRLGAAADAVGNPVATSVSSSAVKPAGKRKKRASDGR